MSSNLIISMFKIYSLLDSAFSLASKNNYPSEIKLEKVEATVEETYNLTTFRPYDLTGITTYRPPNATGKDPNLKYILQWTNSEHAPFLNMGVGQQGFVDRDCLFTNCFVTNYVSLLGDYTEFDAILFYGPDLRYYAKRMLPQRRLRKQKYVFVSEKSSETHPIYMDYFDGFFNWTWTYKVGSDLRWGHIVVTDMNKTVVGPTPYMSWIKKADMYPVSSELRRILERKKRAVVWMPSNCNTTNNREILVKKLQNVLKSLYELDLDIYGECGDLKCIASDDNDDNECSAIIRNDYYFYIAYEESLSVDYVTAEILPALKNHAVPIVHGGADYHRFLPEGSYLNALDLETDLLALTIYNLIQNKRLYEEYFKWTNHYQYYSTLELKDTNPYCKMCALINNSTKLNETTKYDTFRSWWNPAQITERIDEVTEKILRERYVPTATTTTEVPIKKPSFFEKVKKWYRKMIDSIKTNVFRVSPS